MSINSYELHLLRSLHYSLQVINNRFRVGSFILDQTNSHIIIEYATCLTNNKNTAIETKPNLQQRRRIFATRVNQTYVASKLRDTDLINVSDICPSSTSALNFIPSNFSLQKCHLTNINL
jgi:hypothetical protein